MMLVLKGVLIVAAEALAMAILVFGRRPGKRHALAKAVSDSTTAPAHTREG